MNTGNAEKGTKRSSKGSPSPVLVVLVMWLPHSPERGAGQVLALQKFHHPGEHPALTTSSHLSR